MQQSDRQILSKAFHKIGYNFKRAAKCDYKINKIKYYGWEVKNLWSGRTVFYFNKENKLCRIEERNDD